MLEGLDTVDWADLEHAYGSADDVPDLLRGAASEDDEVRDEAIDALFGTIHHQGTVYPASAPAVPFLAQLAVHAPLQRDYVLMLLSEMANGHDIDGGASITRVRAAVADAIPGLLPLLDDPDRDVRRALLRVLITVPEAVFSHLPLLLERMAADPDGQMRADLMTTLARVDPDLDSAERRHRTGLDDPAPAVRIASAIALLSRTAPPFPSDVVDALADAYAIDGDGGFDMPWPGETTGDPLLGDALAEDPAAALAVASRLAGLGVRTREASWQAWDVVEKWRGQEAGCLPVLVAHLPHETDPQYLDNTLLRTARLATRIDEPDEVTLERIRAFADDHTAAVLPALARFHDPSCLTLAERALAMTEPPGHALKAVMAEFGERASALMPLLLPRLRDIDGHSVGGNNLLIALVQGLPGLGQAALAAVPELLAMLHERKAELAVCTTLGELGPPAAQAAPALAEICRPKRQLRLWRPRTSPTASPALRSRAALAHYRITGDPVIALEVFGDLLAMAKPHHWVIDDVGHLGPNGAPLLPHLEPLLTAETGWVRVSAAIELRRMGVTTATEVIAAEVDATPSGLKALRGLANLGSAPVSLEPTLRRLAESPRRLLHDGSNDGTPHDDDVLADLARDLLSHLE
ncbi:HEAT repeat domain-containing protein [Actinomadura sp. HBU206391]|uniref:HEAT repeat domain-containing protein n=1 Tax=Actinomadura sp. HBU206391 TaxID=2731692 RepID=UPI00164FD92D|nr:hypothetical protein [Actinomadura sp. HBU206391]MBC6461680.1 hypothetical protein [Actinomadura sp. HBU206391]